MNGMGEDIKIRRDGSWELLREDSRLRRQREDKQVQGVAGRIMDPVFCFSCGKPDGYGVRTSFAIIAICDDCYQKYGGPPLPQLPPEDEVKWRTGRL